MVTRLESFFFFAAHANAHHITLDLNIHKPFIFITQFGGAWLRVPLLYPCLETMAGDKISHF